MSTVMFPIQKGPAAPLLQKFIFNGSMEDTTPLDT